MVHGLVREGVIREAQDEAGRNCLLLSCLFPTDEMHEAISETDVWGILVYIKKTCERLEAGGASHGWLHARTDDDASVDLDRMIVSFYGQIPAKTSRSVEITI